VARTDYAPILLAFVENNTAYSIKAKDAASSNEFLTKLDEDDRVEVTKLTLLKEH